jgi:uncharacterized protein YbjT (DUF2867 family)
MNILLTGANGYIGTRLLLRLLDAGHHITALVRSKSRFEVPEGYANSIEVIEADLLSPDSLQAIPDEIDAVYYLVHSMSSSSEKFAEMEAQSAKNFRERISQTKAKQIIYLSGLVNDENLSHHLSSRKNVEAILREGKVPVTTLMAGIIIGSGSASFEIMRDLVEKLPVMIAPRWASNLVQPIAIHDVLDYLRDVLGHPDCIGERFEIGGPDVLSYKELLLSFARIRELKRWIFSVPVLTPKLSSYWLYFITSANFSLSSALVESLKNNAICKENRIRKIFPKQLLNFEAAVKRAFQRLQEDNVPSSWKDAMGDARLNPNLSDYIQVPDYGVFKDVQTVPFSKSPDAVKNTIWSLGGEKGWLYMNWAWHVRGFVDKLCRGVGLRRGRTHPSRLKAGDALDFWRVLLADEKNRRLLLYAEMRLPGEAWLEYDVQDQILVQTATFRPRGLCGRLYWILLFPMHFLIFRGLANAIVRESLESKN